MYSIWICQHATANRNTVTRYRMRKEDMAGAAVVEERDYDLLQVVMICLGKADTTQTDVLHLLNVAFSEDIGIESKKETLEQRYGIAMSEPLDKELSGMCNLSVGLIERGIVIGEERGIQIGERRMLETMLGLVRSGKLSLEAAAEALGRTVAEVAALLQEG